MSDQQYPRRGILPKIKTACRLLIAFTFSHVGVCGLVVGYIIIGAFLFGHIEKDSYKDLHKDAVEKVQQLRSETVERLYEIMLNLQINKEAYLSEAEETITNYTYNIVPVIMNEGYESELDNDNATTHSTQNGRWGFSGAFLYSLTVITTIGYGNVAPLTAAGKVATIMYGIVGMPLFLLYLSNIGDILARGFKWAFSRCCQCRWNCAQRLDENSIERDDNELSSISSNSSEIIPEDEQQITVPVSVCLVLMVAYIWGGGLWFATFENWSVLDASYFCFISLSTIGFGDLVPGTSVRAIDLRDAIQLPFIFCSVYLLLGMALIAMCFNLMQEEVISKVRSCGRRLGCLS